MLSERCRRHDELRCWREPKAPLPSHDLIRFSYQIKETYVPHASVRASHQRTHLNRIRDASAACITRLARVEAYLRLVKILFQAQSLHKRHVFYIYESHRPQ